MKEQKLKIEYVPTDSLIPYTGNAKEHPDWQIEQIMLSIKEFGFQDPIGIWKNEIVEGHGRLIAAKDLGMETVPVIRLDQLTDEQRRAYAIVHNKLTMNTDFDWSKLEEEMKKLDGIDMSQYGFDELANELDWFEKRIRNDNEGLENESDEYQEFVKKFEQAKTTDDCYTPDGVYDAVADWVAKEYKLDRKKFVRPFFPGGTTRRDSISRTRSWWTIRRFQFCRRSSSSTKSTGSGFSFSLRRSRFSHHLQPERARFAPG